MLKFQKKGQEVEAEEATVEVKDVATVKMEALVDQKRNSGELEILEEVMTKANAEVLTTIRITKTKVAMNLLLEDQTLAQNQITVPKGRNLEDLVVGQELKHFNFLIN